METVNGVYYWTRRDAALTWAQANGWPTNRIIGYDLGWAIQAGPSGNYAGPGETPTPFKTAT